MLENPYAKYKQPAQQGPLVAPPKPVDPYKEEDQQFQRNADARAAEDQRMQRERDAMQRERDTLQLERDRARMEATGGVDTAGEEKTAAFLTTRMVNANAAIQRALKADKDAQAPGIIETGASLLGETARGFAQSSARQQVYAAQLDLIDAALTLGTGAAYTAEQKEAIGRTLTPQLTDTPATIAEKRRRLLEYLEAGRVKAGAAGGAIDQAVAAVNEMYGDRNATAEDTGLYVDPAMIQPNGKPVGMNPDGSPTNPDEFARARAITESLEIGRKLREGNEATPLGFTNEKYISDDFKARNDELNRLWVSGQIASLSQLKAVLKSLDIGIDPQYDAKLIKSIETKQFSPFTPNPDAERSIAKTAAGKFLDSSAGAFATGAVNATTAGGIDEIIGLVAGEEAGERAQATKEYVREQRPVASIAGEVAGSVIGLKGLNKVAPSAANALATPAGQAAYGATYGALDNNENRLLGAVTGGVVGRYAPTLIQNGANALAPTVSRVTNAIAPTASHVKNAIASRLPGAANRNALAAEVQGNAGVVQAARDEGMEDILRLPDVAPSARNASATMEANPRVGPQYRQALEDDLAKIESRVLEKGGAGNVMEETPLGDTIQGAMARNKEAKRTEFDARYKRVDRLAPDHRAEAKNTIGLIDQEIAALKASAPEGSAGEVEILETIKRDLAKTGLTTDAVRSLRRRVRNLATQSNLDADVFDHFLGDLQKAAGNELEASLAKNPQALGALKSVNKDYADYKDFRDEIERAFVGRKGEVTPEQAAQRLLAMTKRGGNSQGFAKFTKILEPDELNDLRATIAAGLGRSRDGGFSPATLANLVPDGPARAGTHNWATLTEVFGADGVQSLKNLAVIAKAKAGKSGVATQPQTGRLRQLLAGAIGFQAGDVTGALALAGGEGVINRIGEKRAMRLLLNPDFTRWIKNAPDTENPAVINRYFENLVRTAPANTQAAADILIFKQALGDAFSQSPGKLAASEQENN